MATLGNFVLLKYCENSSGTRKTININNFSGLSRERVGVKVVYVLPFSWTKREKSQEISGKCQDSPGIILGQSSEIFVDVFSFLSGFPLP